MSELENVHEQINDKWGDVILSADSIIDKPKEVISICPSLDVALHGGVPEGSVVLCSGKPKIGKAQPLYSKIQTPTGPILMKDIKIGDEVLNPFGTTSKVIGIFPQGRISVYRITTNDGDTVDCSEDHLWEIMDRNWENPKVIPLKDFKDYYIRKGKEERPKYYINIAKPCFYNQQEIPLDAYCLGLLLGDGSFRSKISLTSEDEYLVNRLREKIENGYSLNRIAKTLSYNISKNKDNKEKTHKYRNIIKSLGLWNKKSTQKFIPDSYKYNSIAVRKSLLCGLFDTDGSILSKNGSIEYSTSSPQLSKDVKEMIESLGGRCKITPRQTKCKGKSFPSFRLRISLNDSTGFFSLPRKAKQCRVRRKKYIKRYITNIEYIGEQECQCIKISDDHGLYLTDHHIITHNSSTSLWFAANCQANGRHVYYLDIEGRLQKKNLEGIPHLKCDPKHLTVIRSDNDTRLTAEDYLDIADNILCSHKKALVIVDSISAMCAEKEILSSMKSQTRNEGPKLLAQFCRKVANTINMQNSIVWMIQHLIANTSGYGAAFMEDGGNKIQYQSDIKIRATKYEYWYAKTDKERPIGQSVNWNVLYCALGAPGRSATSYIRFGKGIDEIKEIIEFGSSVGLIKVAKNGWTTCEYLKNYDEEYTDDKYKMHGSDATYDFFVQNPQFLTYLKEEVYKILL